MLRNISDGNDIIRPSKLFIGTGASNFQSMEPEEALRLKAIAEAKYQQSKLKSALKYARRALRLSPDLEGVSEMITAFKILKLGAKLSGAGDSPDWYKILQVEPFSNISTIKKQYKKLALLLHPDKNPFVASEEAFKLIGEAFRCLSDKIRRKEYDLKLRIALQSAAAADGGDGAPETFWTVCSTCRLLHQFESKYIGHNLMCPSCKKSFLALEVENQNNEVLGSKESGDRLGRWRNLRSVRQTRSGSAETTDGKSANVDLIAENVMKSRTEGLKRKMSSVNEVLERSKVMREMTLAEMQKEARRKAQEARRKEKLKEEQEKEKNRMKKLKEKEKEVKEKGKKVKEKEKQMKEKEEGVQDKVKESRIRTKSGGALEIQKRRASKGGGLELQRQGAKNSGNCDIMIVEDSDFYDFDKDRVEKSFKRGQVWAIYDDDDGMPRHYGLIDEVVSVNPFQVKMSWLDLQDNGHEGLILWEKLGFHVSCGRFKVAKKTQINYVNLFSHTVNCERAALEVYRIFPTKGSVWALYNQEALSSAEQQNLGSYKRCYDIVVLLTSYSERYGLSMAYLEKVEGFKAIFTRQEIGCQAVRWLEKDDIRMFSHQIPARKLYGEESLDLSKDYWELDPASLPSDLLT